MLSSLEQIRPCFLTEPVVFPFLGNLGRGNHDFLPNVGRGMGSGVSSADCEGGVGPQRLPRPLIPI